MLGEFILKSCSSSACQPLTLLHKLEDLTYCMQDQKNKGTFSKPPRSNQWLWQRIWSTTGCQCMSHDWSLRSANFCSIATSPLLSRFLKVYTSCNAISSALTQFRTFRTCQVFIGRCWDLLRVNISSLSEKINHPTEGACFDFFLFSFRNCLGLGIVTMW